MPTRRHVIRFLTGLMLAGVVGGNTVHSSEPILKVQGLASGQPISIALDLPAMDKMPQTSFSTTTLQEAGALLATRQNGTIMPVSDKGPVFLVFPFDSRPELQHQTYYSRAVWQIAEINVQ